MLATSQVTGIMTSSNGAKYLIFGDDDREYQLIQGKESSKEGVHTFEVWEGNSKMISQVNVEADQQATDGQIFASALRQSQSELADREELKHLQDCLADAINDFPFKPYESSEEMGEDFTRAVSELPTLDGDYEMDR